MNIGEQIRHPVMVRFAEKDTEPVIDWCQANSDRNAFDKDVLDYPCTKILAAHIGDKVLAYMPVQSVAVLESIGVNPEATALEVANGVLEMVRGAALLAHGGGMREVMFLASDEVTAEGAAKLGFEEVPYKCFRKRLND